MAKITTSSPLLRWGCEVPHGWGRWIWVLPNCSIYAHPCFLSCSVSGKCQLGCSTVKSKLLLWILQHNGKWQKVSANFKYTFNIAQVPLNNPKKFGFDLSEFTSTVILVQLNLTWRCCAAFCFSTLKPRTWLGLNGCNQRAMFFFSCAAPAVNRE